MVEARDFATRKVRDLVGSKARLNEEVDGAPIFALGPRLAADGNVLNKEAFAKGSDGWRASVLPDGFGRVFAGGHLA